MSRTESFQRVWASDPVPGQFESPPNATLQLGWQGGAQAQLPEAKWENWWHNRVDEALAEIESNGVLSWFEDVSYGVGAAARNGGKNWIAAIANSGIEPGGVDDAGHWQELSLEIASKAEAEDGDEATSSNVKRMTPLRVLQAIKARISSASEAVAGMLRIGTQAEVNAGALDNVAVTPKKLRFGFGISLTDNGYIAFPSWLGGLILQWGLSTTSASGSVEVTLPIAFPNRIFNAFAVDTAATSSSVAPFGVDRAGWTLSKIRFYVSPTGATEFGWWAIGH